MPEHVRRQPTHVLYVEVPIHAEGQPEGFDPWRDAIKAVLAVSRAAYDGIICADPMVSVRDGATICGLCGGYGAANEKTREPVPCMACGKKSEGMVLTALDPPRAEDIGGHEPQHLGLRLVYSGDEQRDWERALAAGQTIVFYCHACGQDTPYAREPRCERCGGADGQVTGFGAFKDQQSSADGGSA